MDLPQMVGAVAEYVCSLVGVPPEPGRWDDLVAELRADMDLYVNAAALMADATQPIGMES